MEDREFADALSSLAVAQAVFNAVGSVVSTKDEGSLRKVIDNEAKARFEETGFDRCRINVNGMQVGTYSLRVSKPTKEKHEKRLVINSYAELEDYMDKEPAVVSRFMADHCSEFANWVLKEYGEVPSGCEVVEDVVPASDGRVLGGTLKVDKQKVAEAMGNSLPSAVAGLLEEGR